MTIIEIAWHICDSQLFTVELVFISRIKGVIIIAELVAVMKENPCKYRH